MTGVILSVLLGFCVAMVFRNSVDLKKENKSMTKEISTLNYELNFMDSIYQKNKTQRLESIQMVEDCLDR